MKIVIFGAGGHAKVVQEIFFLNGIEVTGFIDDDKKKQGTFIMGLPVLGGSELLPDLINRGITHIFPAIGDNRKRESVMKYASEIGYDTLSAVHPSAIISPSATIGRGAFIGFGSIIVTEATLGEYVIVNTGASVGHECFIDSYSEISPGVRLAGQVRVGKYTRIGMGTSVIQCVTIGTDATLGAGSVVVRDIPSNTKAYGVPAKIIST
jgi:sugar O-acyltransferase (sialic acid O-acetyltransferase NeuD family)